MDLIVIVIAVTDGSRFLCASVFRGLMGYGANSRIHTASIVDLSGDLPILVEVIDSEAYINQLLPFLDEMLDEGGMITIDDIEVIKYGKKPPKG